MNIATTTRAATLFLAVFMAGCMDAFNHIKGSGIAKTETRAVEDFHAVRLNGAADVSITIGQPAQLTVTGDDNIVPVIDTDVHDGTLVIGNRESYNTQMGVKIVIVTPSLDAFELNGSGNVKIKDLSGEKFSAKIRGSGDLSAEGTVDRLDASISGSGDMRLGELKVKSADVSIAGSGSATVNAEESMSASISGSGDIRYKGNPSKVQSSVAGSGSVHKI
jgi:hypothetical protein